MPFGCTHLPFGEVSKKGCQCSCPVERKGYCISVIVFLYFNLQVCKRLEKVGHGKNLLNCPIQSQFLHYFLFWSSIKSDNYLPYWWVEFDDELTWLFNNRFRATRYMKVKRVQITEILRRIWLFSANRIKVLNLAVNNQLNSSSNSTHDCSTKLPKRWWHRLSVWQHFLHLQSQGLKTQR